MWSSARFSRSANVLGLSSVDIQKSLKNCRTVSRRRSISCLLGEASDVMPIWWLSGRSNAIGDRLFLCHDIHSFTGCVRIRTALPLTGQFVAELDYDLDPTRHLHMAPRSHRKLDLFVCGDQSGCNTRGRADVVARPGVPGGRAGVSRYSRTSSGKVSLHMKRPHVAL